MAEAKNKLGELFLEFGSKGLGSLVKGVNALSAQFLLTKNAAQQAIKPIVDISKNAGNNIQNLDKLTAVMGLSTQQLMQIKYWTKSSGVEFGSFIGELQKMQQAINKFGFDGSVSQGWQLLGIDPRSLDYKDPLKAYEQLRERLSKLDPVTAGLGLEQLGLSRDMLYAFEQGNKEIDKRLLLSNKELNNLRQQQQAWNDLSATWELAVSKLAANLPVITNAVKGLADQLSRVDEFIKSINRFSGTLGRLMSNDVEQKKQGVKEVVQGAKTGVTKASELNTKAFLVNNLAPAVSMAQNSNVAPFFQNAIKAFMGVEQPRVRQTAGANKQVSMTVNQYLQGRNDKELAEASTSALKLSFDTVVTENRVIT